MTRVAVVGCGLIGGSLLQALHARGGHELVAVDTDPATRDAIGKALSIRAVAALAELPWRPTVLVLAQPIPTLLASLGAIADDGVVVTDVGGVKGPVGDAARHLRFVGGHPMAGKEHGGFAHAEASLFEGRTVAICPGDRATAADVGLVEAIWHDAGARTIRCTAADHDEAVARVSHLPYLAAAAVATLGGAGGVLADRLAAGGFRDTSRVAEDPTVRFAAEANPALPALAREAARLLAEWADALERHERPDAALDAAARARARIVRRS